MVRDQNELVERFFSLLEVILVTPLWLLGLSFTEKLYLNQYDVTLKVLAILVNQLHYYYYLSPSSVTSSSICGQYLFLLIAHICLLARDGFVCFQESCHCPCRNLYCRYRLGVGRYFLVGELWLRDFCFGVVSEYLVNATSFFIINKIINQLSYKHSPIKIQIKNSTPLICIYI